MYVSGTIKGANIAENMECKVVDFFAVYCFGNSYWWQFLSYDELKEI